MVFDSFNLMFCLLASLLTMCRVSEEVTYTLVDIQVIVN